MNKQLISSDGREVFGIISPGLPMFFQFPTQKSNYRTAFVGAVADAAVILQLPATPGVTQLLEEAYSVVVRFVHEGLAYGFETRFLAAVRKPLPLLFLSFPTSVHKMRLRACDRLELVEKAEIEAGGALIESVMTDISCGGCKLKAPRTDEALALVVGQELSVSFGLNEEGRVAHRLAARVVDLEQKGKKVKFRLAFLTGQDEELSKLNNSLQTIVKILRE